jgi:hypothetical protein
MAVRAAAEALVARAAALGHRGWTLTPQERQRVAAALPVYPVWLLDLLSAVPLCGLRLGWRAFPPKPDWDGVLWVEVSDAASILAESLELYPGIGILPAGYVNFGGGDGSGDPYFVCAHEGDDPPLYEVYHDVGTDAAAILAEGRNLVAPNLSEFFRVAVLEGESGRAEPGAAVDGEA